MERIAGNAIAHELGIDMRTARLRVLQLLEQTHTRALAHHKTAATRIKGDGCARGIVPCMKRTHGCKATDGKRRYRRLGSTRKHDIGIAIANLTKGIAYGVRTACASGNRTRATCL